LTRELPFHKDASSNVSREIPAEVHSLSPSARLSPLTGDRLANRVLAYGLLGAVVGFLLANYEAILESLRGDLPRLGLWTAMIILINLFPVWLREATFTMDMPLLLAVAVTYPPETTTLVALVASLDVRELRGRVSVARALFNRSQIALLVLIAGWIFHRLAESPFTWTASVPAILAATAASFLLNLLLVGLYTGLRHGQSWSTSLRTFRDESVGEFAVTYVAYCGLALVLAFLSEEVGMWSVLLFLAPTIVAQLMLARGRSLRALAEELRGRERLLEQLSDRIVDERRDERRRIAADLHDDVLQSLIRVSQLGGFLRRELPPGSQALTDAEELSHLSHETIDQLRQVVGDLQQSPVGRGGLVPTLQGLARELQLIWRTRIDFEAVNPPQLAPAQQILAYQMIREAMLNALKHSQGSRVDVLVGQEEGHLLATVRDDGRGFVPEGVGIQSQFGIGLMQERARLSGGTIRINSAPGMGTFVRITVPPE
jgi:signal transduction histidine kinase